MSISVLTKRAFTLIELSIVLVIIGLLAGGALVGRSLLRQSEVASIMVDEQKYVAAIKAFKDKYAALPGDMSNATSYWGAAGGIAPYDATTTCITFGATTSPATCNGDGNGMINAAGTYQNEVLRVWQHLADAGFITGSYTGTAPNTVEHIIGVNVPDSKVTGGGFQVHWHGMQISNPNVFDGAYGHRIIFGARYTAAGLAGPVLTGAEAQSVDSKLDDGKPGAGFVRAWKPGAWGNNCSTTASADTALYTTASGLNCGLIFITGL